jgi:hypothetical protein
LGWLTTCCWYAWNAACNSPYGGQGELSVGENSGAIFHVTFVNTPAIQRLKLIAPAGTLKNGNAEPTIHRVGYLYIRIQES